MEKRTYTKVICDLCGAEYEKALSEVNRNKKLNRKSYCSRRCLGISNTNNIPSEKRNADHLQKGSKKDQYSGFREFLRRIKNRKKHECDLDLQYLLDLWNKQEGKCIYTNVSMILPHGVSKGTMFTASLDRIDSSLGYVKGNVQYTLTSVNFMKNNMSNEETKELIKLIVNNY